MDKIKLIQILGFSPKENTAGIYHKIYSKHDNYEIQVDFEEKLFHFGGQIKIQDKNIQNITKPEDWVVFECVNRLLETGYKPNNISLEKVYPAGHGTSGRLDICVTRKDGTEYLLIECKTYGKEFDKEFSRFKKDGGQLFTYFKFSNKADLIMLYASQLSDDDIIYRNEIIKIEDKYRVGDVKDFHNAWNKITKQQGIWENPPYDFKSKIFTKTDLIELNKVESAKIFHEFASILRKHSVSDKPNAFNKIFNLFLAKLYDEAKRENDELEFRWREDDNAVDFQVRLINLHKEGLYAFLQKEIEGIDDKDFKANSPEELLEKKKKVLKFNNILAIKEVLDDASFDENQRVLKDVVKLLEKYQIRYPRKQQHLSDFFEKLLTTGLKQEVGQYFTPPPITKFIVRSLPIKQMIEKEVNKEVPELPAIIDYAAGSGHFITEALEEYQDIINAFTENEIKKFYPKAIKQVKSWQADPYEWASKYVYGIEKDYRLVKVAKVGCYFYGDGVAQIIHGDGLDSFRTSKTYKGLLKENTNLEDSTKAKFSLVLSNPPYSVNDCKDDLEYIGGQNDFSLYPYLTDKSDDIECLFVERTKHLLKDGGVAGIILPSSILNNTGIYTQTREIILKYFDIIGITELGSGTFMATGTNTVTLFLRRRNNEDAYNIEETIKKFFTTLKDVTINGIEKPVHKYVTHVWEGLSFDDYITLLGKKPNEVVKKHEIYKDYDRKNKAKDEADKLNNILALEKEKLLYFIIAYPQKLVLVKTGEKNEEKRFLGYEFSNRRGGEGIHPIQRGKTIDECTQLFDPETFDNPQKASTYIYKAFQGEFDLDIADNLKKNISYQSLVDMMDFDRVTFEKTISLSAKKKVKIESEWEQLKLSEVLETLESGNRPKGGVGEYLDGIPSLGGEHIDLNGKISVNKDNLKFVPTNFFNSSKQGILKDLDILICKDGALTGKVALFKSKDLGYETSMINEHVFILRSNKKAHQKFLFNLLLSKTGQELLKINVTGQAQGGLNRTNLLDIKIPIPPLKVQEKIVKEIEVLELIETDAKKKIEECRASIFQLFNEAELKSNKTIRLSDSDVFEVSIGKRVLKNEFVENGKIPVYSANVIEPFGNIDKLLITDFSIPSVLWGIDGDWMVNYLPKDNPFYPTDHCGVLRVKDNSVNEKYLAFILEKEGMKSEFSRTKRASIERVIALKINIPPFSEQQEIVARIEEIEIKIAALEKEIADIPKLKADILKKYL